MITTQALPLKLTFPLNYQVYKPQTRHRHVKHTN